MGLAPVNPVIGMIELDANVAHQPTPRHVFPWMTGVAGLGQVLGHVQGKLLDHGPATDQVLTHGPATESTVPHALIKLVLHYPTLALMTVLDQLLSPERITAGVHQWTGPNKRINHCQLLVPCDYLQAFFNERPQALVTEAAAQQCAGVAGCHR
ncbi:hypothetical protein D3C77_417530 [compost metagenome]